jgi:MSHA pilin protein MshD
MYSEAPSAQRGVTLIELVIFMVVIGIGVAGILGVMSLATKTSADPVRRKQALLIAESLLEEVELAQFTYCDPSDSNADSASSSAGCASIPEKYGQAAPEPAGPRPYDNVNDYVDAAGTPKQAFDVGNVLSDANGNAMNLQGYSATVAIVPEVLGTGAGAIPVNGTAADNDVLRITVDVAYAAGQHVVLDGYRTRYLPTTQ